VVTILAAFSIGAVLTGCGEEDDEAVAAAAAAAAAEAAAEYVHAAHGNDSNNQQHHNQGHQGPPVNPWAGVESNLPEIEVNTSGAEINSEEKVLGTLSVVGDATDYQGFCGLKFRGQSSLSYPKKSYTLEIWDESGEDADPDVEILGFPIDEDYVLYGPFHDKTGMKNYYTYTLARSLGRWAPKARFVGLTVNGVHHGLYVLTEKIKRDKHRVAVQKDPKDGSTDHGYLWKADKADEDEAKTDKGRVFVYPKKPTEAQIQFLSKLLEDFSDSIPIGADPMVGYPAFIDVQSFHDEWILQQLAGNPDAFHSSSYFSRDAGGKIVAGPIWDLNLGYGNAPGSVDGITGWLTPTKSWWIKLSADSTFVNGLIVRYHELRKTKLSDAAMLAIIDDAIPQIGPVASVEYAGAGDWNAWSELLRTWIIERAAWMDANIDALAMTCTPDCTAKACGWDGCSGSCGGCASGETCADGECIELCQEAGCALMPFFVYRDGPKNSYEEQPFGAIDTAVPETEGDGLMIRLACDEYDGIVFYRKDPIPATYTQLVFRVHGGDEGGQPLRVKHGDDKIPINQHVLPGQWNEVVMPIVPPARKVRFDCKNGHAKALLLDDIRFEGTL